MTPINEVLTLLRSRGPPCRTRKLYNVRLGTVLLLICVTSNPCGIMALCLLLLRGKVPMAEGYGVSEGFVTWQDHEVGFSWSSVNPTSRSERLFFKEWEPVALSNTLTNLQMTILRYPQNGIGTLKKVTPGKAFLDLSKVISSWEIAIFFSWKPRYTEKTLFKGYVWVLMFFSLWTPGGICFCFFQGVLKRGRK